MIETFNTPRAPKPLGSYSHAVRYENLIFTAGIGPRHPQTNEVPGLVLDSEGRKRAYDIVLETRMTLENIKVILEDLGSSLDKIIEIQTFLLRMEDFNKYNEVFSEYFIRHKPARTTLGVSTLPGNISIEMKAIAER